MILRVHDSDLVLGIVCRIRQRVAEGVWAKGSQLPNRNELAALFQTSSSTVQAAIRILNADGSVITRKRAGTCVATSAPEYGRFALVMSDHGPDPLPGSGLFHDKLLQLATHIPTLRAGWRLEPWRADDPALLALVRSGGLEGILYIGVPQKLPQVAGSGIPLACYHYDGAPWYGDVNLIARKQDFIATCTQVLLRQQQHRIGVIDGDLYSLISSAKPHVREPAQEIVEIIQAKGGTCAAAWVQCVDVNRPVAAYHAVLLLLAHPHERPTALILTDDHLLPGVRQAAHDLGLKIPQQLAICTLGFEAHDVNSDGCERVGFDLERMLLESLQQMAQLRQGKAGHKELPCRYRDLSA